MILDDSRTYEKMCDTNVNRPVERSMILNINNNKEVIEKMRKTSFRSSAERT